MSNYDVIESYIIDFTTFNNRDDAIINNNKFVFTGNVVVGINYERIQIEKYNSYKILIKGLTGGIYYYYRNADGVENYIIFNKDGVYDIPVSYKQGTEGIIMGYTCNSTTECTVTQLPTSILNMWRTSYNQQNQRFEDRQTINQEMFGIYSAMRNGFDIINATANKNAFDLYKYSRDNKDELAGQIGELKTEVAVLKATRPYQDALIQCDIRRVAEHADFNLWRRTCRMISGEVVLPNTPTVTGYASYNPCDCHNNSAQTPAA